MKDGLAHAARAPGADRNARTKNGCASSTAIPTKSRRSCSTPSPSTTRWSNTSTCRLQHASAPVLKRMKRGANGDIFLKLIERIRAHHPRRGDPHQHDRRLPRRNRAGFRSAVPVRPGRAIRPPGRLLLFRRGHQQELRAGRQSGRPDHLQPQAPPDGASSARSRAQRNRALVGREFRCWSKAPPPIPIWSGRRACPRKRPKSTASATSPTPASIPLNAGRNAHHAHHRGARLRSDRRADRCASRSARVQRQSCCKLPLA